jgi:hypothetical protein
MIAGAEGVAGAGSRAAAEASVAAAGG